MNSGNRNLRKNIDHEVVSRLLIEAIQAEIPPLWRSRADHHVTEKRPDDTVTIANGACEAALSQELVRLRA